MIFIAPVATAALLAAHLVSTNHLGPQHRGSHQVPHPLTPSEIAIGKRVCPMVAAARAAGMTDDEIVAVAVTKGYSPLAIVWAKKNCIRAP